MEGAEFTTINIHNAQGPIVNNIKKCANIACSSSCSDVEVKCVLAAVAKPSRVVSTRIIPVSGEQSGADCRPRAGMINKPCESH